MANEIVIYQSDDGSIRLETRLENETLWLTQQQMAELFQTSKQNISHHIRSIYEEGELTAEATVKYYLTVQREGNRDVQRNLEFYNLDMVISVGYRVKSLIATRFRIWATTWCKKRGLGCAAHATPSTSGTTRSRTKSSGPTWRKTPRSWKTRRRSRRRARRRQEKCFSTTPRRRSRVTTRGRPWPRWGSGSRPR